MTFTVAAMVDDDDDDVELSLDAVFAEPPRPSTPKPTFAVYTRQSSRLNDWTQVKIRLVGTHPLWGNYLWNAARAFASYLDENPDFYQNRSVLELGAGGGLPSIVAAKNGARQVVVTDYPDDELIENMTYNVEANVPVEKREHVSVQGYIWGRPVGSLLSVVEDLTPGFDLIILSDLIFNHSQHDALLTTCELAISSKSNDQSPPSVLVFYTHHRPHLAHRDMLFFVKARERGWDCEEILARKFPPMFPEDPGEEAVRSTVHGWRLSRQPYVPDNDSLVGGMPYKWPSSWFGAMGKLTCSPHVDSTLSPLSNLILWLETYHLRYS